MCDYFLSDSQQTIYCWRRIRRIFYHIVNLDKKRAAVCRDLRETTGGSAAMAAIRTQPFIFSKQARMSSNWRSRPKMSGRGFGSIGSAVKKR